MEHPISTRRLSRSDASIYRELRLEGLETEPSAFGASLNEEANQPLTWFENRLDTNIVFGAFVKEVTLVGVVGLHIPSAIKTCHKGEIWGMFIKPAVRGSGVGKTLMACIAQHAERVVEEILLTVVSSNTVAVGMYKNLGFEEYVRERRALKVGTNYEDELLMVLSFRK